MKPQPGCGLDRRAFLATAAAAALAGVTSPIEARKAAVATATAEKPPREILSQARSWAYQLQNYDFRALAASTADVLVVDYSINGDENNPISESAVRRLQRKGDGTRRIVLAYLSIGEAEEYRFYWNKDWIETDAKDAAADAPGAAAGVPVTQSPEPAKPARWLSPTAPVWLGDENESWSGNFAVKYWEPGWQDLIVGTGGSSYLDRILAAGFDGVYLDRVDAFYEFSDERPTAADEMVAFVGRIAAEARRRRPGFLVVPQNGEELLMRAGYVDIIDAIAKEDLLYGSPEQGKPNSPAQVANTNGWLSQARRAGRPVLVIEYIDDRAEIAEARRQLVNLGYVPTFGPRLLDGLSPESTPPP